MRVDKFMQSLQVYEELFEGADCIESADMLRALRQVFAGHENKTIVALVNHTLKYWKSVDRLSAYPESLKRVISGIEAVHRKHGPVGVANDYKKLASLFVGEGNLSIVECVADMTRALNAPVVNVGRKKAGPDLSKVDGYVARLKSLIEDADGFLEILQELAAPRKVTKAEVDLVAEKFLGYKGNYKTKKNVLESLKVWQLHDAIQKSQDRASAKIAV